jgi:uncharacterized protein (DUF1330 family)
MIVQIEWKSPEARMAYIKDLSSQVERRGGRFLVASSEAKVVEGDWKPGRTVLLEFPTMEALKGWYESEEYRPLLELRLKNSSSHAIFVDGAPSRPAAT